jgi:integrase
MMFLLDTGVRINEALSLQKSDLGLDNLVFRVSGKGTAARDSSRMVGHPETIKRLVNC